MKVGVSNQTVDGSKERSDRRNPGGKKEPAGAENALLDEMGTTKCRTPAGTKSGICGWSKACGKSGKEEKLGVGGGIRKKKKNSRCGGKPPPCKRVGLQPRSRSLGDEPPSNGWEKWYRGMIGVRTGPIRKRRKNQSK